MILTFLVKKRDPFESEYTFNLKMIPNVQEGGIIAQEGGIIA